MTTRKKTRFCVSFFVLVRFCSAKPVACGRVTERARETRLRFPLHTFPSLRYAGVRTTKVVGNHILTKRYRCVWRKVRRINRFRAFSSPDFFSQTIDANRCFRASAPIRTGRFPVSCRCVQPAPFFSGDFSGWQRYFSQKRITKIWASFCWS